MWGAICGRSVGLGGRVSWDEVGGVLGCGWCVVVCWLGCGFHGGVGHVLGVGWVWVWDE